MEPVQKKTERVGSVEALGKLQIGDSAGKQKLCRVEMTPSDPGRQEVAFAALPASVTFLCKMGTNQSSFVSYSALIYLQ